MASSIADVGHHSEDALDLALVTEMRHEAGLDVARFAVAIRHGGVEPGRLAGEGALEVGSGDGERLGAEKFGHGAAVKMLGHHPEPIVIRTIVQTVAKVAIDVVPDSPLLPTSAIVST